MSGMWPILCEICETEFSGETYGEDNHCPKCGQIYSYDEGQNIRLSDAQLQLLRTAQRRGESQ